MAAIRISDIDDRVTVLENAVGGAGGTTLFKSANGYWRDDNTGFIIQWGYKSGSSSGMNTVTFPIAFPSACRSVTTQEYHTGVTFDGDPAYIVSRSQFKYGNWSNKAYWVAVGY